MGAATPFDLPRPFGPYELVRQLAAGGVAEIFLARARSVAGFEKAVALKMIHPRLSADPEFARLLIEEARINSQLSHKNIVQVIDLGQLDGTHYIAMEYVDGADVSRLLARLRERGTQCAPRVAAYVVREVCEGLDHAHRKVSQEGKPLRIVHRDVSPANILVSFAGEVKLTDFGLAKAVLRAQNTEAGVIKGKYGYMAPEQAKGGAVDARTDVFAAGAVLYEMVTGKPMYPDVALPILIERVTRAAFEPPDKVAPGTPRALVDVIARATAADPAQRYPTARAMADDLTSFLYTQTPNPELELGRLLESLTDAARNSLKPMGALLVDDDSEEVTEIETVAVIRAKFLASRSERPGAVAPAPREPEPEPEPEPPAPDPRPTPVDRPMPSGGNAQTRPGNVARVRHAPRQGIGAAPREVPAPRAIPPPAPVPAPAPAPAVVAPPVAAPAPVAAPTVPAPAMMVPPELARAVVRAPTMPPVRSVASPAPPPPAPAPPVMEAPPPAPVAQRAPVVEAPPPPLPPVEAPALAPAPVMAAPVVVAPVAAPRPTLLILAVVLAVLGVGALITVMLTVR